MFYSSEILNIKSNSHLGIVWLAATLGPKSNAKRLGRKELNTINIQNTCSFLKSPPEPLSLRLSANLMIGVSRVYGQQCYYHMSDVQAMCTKLSHVNKPANSEAIDLAQDEKKGQNITLKKIDCITAVNVLPGDPLNFPDLDISNLLLLDSNRRSSTSSIYQTEMGRKNSFLLSTPFSNTSSSSNVLQGSDFASVIGGDIGSMIDNEMMYSDDLGSTDLHLRPQAPNIHNSSSSLELFHVPNELIQKRQRTRARNLKNQLMDQQDLMLEKDQLFINEHELLKVRIICTYEDPLNEALKLLNNPEGSYIEAFNTIFAGRPQFSSLKPIKSNYSKTITENVGNISIDMDMGIDGYDGDVETYRRDSIASFSSHNNTPRNLILPWSSSSTKLSNDNTSSSFNTPIRKGSMISSTAGQSTPSPLMEPFDELKLSSSSDQISPFKNLGKTATNISEETFDFFYYLQDSLTSKIGKNALKMTTFRSLLNLEGTDRPVAARAFHHILELKSANLIQVKQNNPFSDIQISIPD